MDVVSEQYRVFRVLYRVTRKDTAAAPSVSGSGWLLAHRKIYKYLEMSGPAARNWNRTSGRAR